MKKLLFLLGVLLLISSSILLIRYLYVQWSYDYSWGYINTNSPEQSKIQGRFVRDLKTIPNEVYFDSEYNVLFSKAWLEYGRTAKKNTFSVKEEPSYNTLVLNVYYKYKDKKTGEIKNYVGTRDLCLTTLDEQYGAFINLNLNLLSIHVDYPTSLNTPIKLRLSDGSNSGVLVTFK